MEKVLVTLIDDLDGTEADETVSFSLDGADYAIDLSQPNAEALRQIFADYVQHGRRTAARPKRPAKPRTTKAPTPPRNRAVSANIRKWAREQGIELAAVGRIPGDVRRRYMRRNRKTNKGKSAPPAGTNS